MSAPSDPSDQSDSSDKGRRAGRLPLSQKLSYGVGGLSMNLCDAIFMQWILMRYVPSGEGALVPAQWMGACVLASRVFEACIGPMVGHWSDNCRSPLGRRIPFIRRGMVALAIAFFLLWTPPLRHLHWVNALYAMILIPTYLLCYNVTVTPYLSLLPEIARAPEERVALTTFQAVFVLLSLILAALTGAILDIGGWTLLAVGVGLITLAGFYPAGYRIRETYRHDPERGERVPFFRGLAWALRNRPFLYLVLGTSAYWFGLNSIQILLPFWVVNGLGRAEADVTLVMVPFLVTSMLAFPVVNVLANRYGKYPMMLATFLLTALFALMLPLVGIFPIGSRFLQTLFVVSLMGIPVAGFMVLPFALLADVVDYDERLTGRRREALYFGFQGTFQKVALGLASFAFMRIVYWGDVQTVTVHRLKLVAVVAALCCFVGFVVFLGFPLRERATRKSAPPAE